MYDVVTALLENNLYEKDLLNLQFNEYQDGQRLTVKTGFKDVFVPKFDENYENFLTKLHWIYEIKYTENKITCLEDHKLYLINKICIEDFFCIFALLASLNNQ